MLCYDANERGSNSLLFWPASRLFHHALFIFNIYRVNFVTLTTRILRVLSTGVAKLFTGVPSLNSDGRSRDGFARSA